MERSFDINKRLKCFVEQNDKRPTAIADKAKIRRDTFSRILNCKRPIYADEIFPISNAAGCSIAFLLGIKDEPTKDTA